jgi:hypothetical protein
MKTSTQLFLTQKEMDSVDKNTFLGKGQTYFAKMERGFVEQLAEPAIAAK